MVKLVKQKPGNTTKKTGWKRHLTWSNVKTLLIAIVLGVGIGLGTHYKTTIVTWFRPHGEKVKALKGGWAIFGCLAIILTIPPLAGHEILGFVIGVIWYDDLYAGLAIMGWGCLIGELGEFAVFKYSFQAWQARQMKSKNFRRVKEILQGPTLFWKAVFLRLSVIPGHFTTPILVQVGMSWAEFIILAVLTLPYLLVPVWFGYLFGQPPEKKKTETEHRKKIENIINWVSISTSTFFSVTVAIWLGWNFWRLAQKEKKQQDGGVQRPGAPLQAGSSRQAVSIKAETLSDIASQKSGADSGIVMLEHRPRPPPDLYRTA